MVEERHGNRSTNNAPRNIYRTSDGHWVAVSTSAQQSRRAGSAPGRPPGGDRRALVRQRARPGRSTPTCSTVSSSDWIGSRTREEVLAAFEQAGAAVAPSTAPKDIVERPAYPADRMLTEVDDADLGRMLMHNVMWRMSATPGRIRFTGRPLGADTDAVLTDELGYDAAELARLREQGVVA